MLVAYYDNKGKLQKDKKELQADVFAAKVNDKLLAQAVNTFLANQRQSNAQTKDRGEVSGGGKKPWRQKGTGRARAGSSRSPIWKGGGVTFGPTNELNFKKGLNSKMRKLAMVSSLSKQALNDNIVVFSTIELKEGKTKDLLKIIGDFANEKLLIVQPEADKNLFNAACNLKDVKLEVVNAINYFDVLNAKKIIILEKSLETINKFWGGYGKVVEKKVKKETKKVVKSEAKKVKSNKEVKTNKK
jgi:large subunit ribosomal protein L4